ncbi:hypothetical protein ACJMK2_027350, partial [Sinanodonta woodiana]
ITITVTGSDHVNMTWNVTCEASGFPTNYTFHPWKHMLGEVTIRSDLLGNHEGNSSKNTLTLDNVSLEDIGTYVCAVDNGVQGVDGDIIQTKATVLHVKGRPLMIATFYYNRFMKDGIEFHFRPGFNGGRKQTFVIEYSSVTSLVWTNTSITDLQEDQTEHRLTNGTYFVTVTKPSPGHYIYRMYSKNSIGRSPYSLNVSVAILSDNNNSHANPLVKAVAGCIGTAILVILCVAAIRFLMTKRILSTKKSSGAVYENMPVQNANVNVYTEYVNNSAVRQFGAEVNEDAESVYENRNDVDMTVLGHEDNLLYADLELANPKANKEKPIVHGLQNRTEYAEISFGKRGEPLPDSDDEN